MSELIRTQGGVSILDIETSNKIAEFELWIKKLKEQEEALKEAIKAEMEAKGIIKVEDEINGITISYIAETMRETFDSKKFKADNPDMYDEYIRMSPVKSSIRIKVKG